MGVKLVSFLREGSESWGIVKDNGIVDMGKRHDGSVLEQLQKVLSMARR